MNEGNDDDNAISNSNDNNDSNDNTPKYIYLWSHISFFFIILLMIPFLYMSTQITRENINKLPVNLINYKPTLNHSYINNISIQFICYSESNILTSVCLHQIREQISIDELQNLIQQSNNVDDKNINLYIVDRNVIISNFIDNNSYELILFDNNKLYGNEIFDYDKNIMNIHPIGVCIFTHNDINDTNQQIEAKCKQILQNKIFNDLNRLDQDEKFTLSKNNIITLDIATEDGYLSNNDHLSISFFENIITRNIESLFNLIPIEINIKVSRFPNLEKYYNTYDFSNCRYRYIKDSDGEKVVDSIVDNDLCIHCNHINIIIYIPSNPIQSESIVDESDTPGYEHPLLFKSDNQEVGSIDPCITTSADGYRANLVQLVTGIITSPKKSMLIFNSFHEKVNDEILISSLNILRDQLRTQLLPLHRYDMVKPPSYNSYNSNWLSAWDLLYLKTIWSNNMLFNSIQQLNSLEIHLNSNSDIEISSKIKNKYDLAVTLLSLSLHQYLDTHDNIYTLNNTFFNNVKEAHDLTQKLLNDPSLVPRLSFPLEQVINLFYCNIIYYYYYILCDHTNIFFHICFPLSII
jgi:hypothetical protein